MHAFFTDSHVSRDSVKSHRKGYTDIKRPSRPGCLRRLVTQRDHITATFHSRSGQIGVQAHGDVCVRRFPPLRVREACDP